MVRRALALFEEALILAEKNGVCYCGASLREHPDWDNHSPRWMVHPDDEALLDVLVPYRALSVRWRSR